MQSWPRPMKPKRAYLSYAIFFIVCFGVFVALNREPGGQLQQRSDAILILLITAFSAFIVFYDFRRRLRPSQIIGPIAAFTLVNLIVTAAIYVAQISLSVGFIIPAFMIGGALVYWFLEKRAAALDG